MFVACRLLTIAISSHHPERVACARKGSCSTCGEIAMPLLRPRTMIYGAALMVSFHGAMTLIAGPRSRRSFRR